MDGDELLVHREECSFSEDIFEDVIDFAEVGSFLDEVGEQQVSLHDGLVEASSEDSIHIVIAARQLEDLTDITCEQFIEGDDGWIVVREIRLYLKE